jgi:hypothetical protein
MKKSVFLLSVILSFPLAAQEKKDIELQTEVSEATVFIKGAQIVRQTTAMIPAGRSTVKFVNLSPYIDMKSVQVKLGGEVMALSVNYQLNYNDTVKQTGETEKIRKQLLDLEEKIKVEQTAKEAINQELAFLFDNRKIGGTEGVDFNNLKTASTYYGERFSALKIKEIEVDRKINSLLEEKTAIERKIAVSGDKLPEPAGEVVLNVDCKTAVRVPVELSYYVNNAGWYPSYDIRAKTISEPVELVYKANIMQNTKERWKNIKLKVSSANPNLGNVAPKLKTYLLDYHTRPPRYTDNVSNHVGGKIMDAKGEPLPGASVMIKGSTIGTNSDMDGNYTLSVPAGGGDLEVSFLGMKTKIMPILSSRMDIFLEEEDFALDEVVVVGYGTMQQEKAFMEESAVASSTRASKNLQAKQRSLPLPVVQLENQTSVAFEIKTPYTILPENKHTTVEMEHYSVAANYEYYCVPKIDRDAFLLANISGWEQYNLLEGEANIFFENTFVGKTILDVRNIGDTLNLSLGRDKNVSVQREKVKEYSTQKFFGNKTETTRDWKITVRNNKHQPISIVVFDQVPVSTLQEIEVSTENLSGGMLDQETGEVRWQFTLKPAQKNELGLRYKVRYPKGKTLPVE